MFHVFVCMPSLTAKERLKATAKPKRRSIKDAASVNQEFQDEGLSYSGASSSASSPAGLRTLKQVSYPELCSWSQEKCWKYLFDAGVLSDEVPCCYSCFEPLTKVDRTQNGPMKCKNSDCYIRPMLTWPREAYTPLHSQVRQYLGSQRRN